MSLEQIAKMYGMTDYYDMNSGYIYHLSTATDNGDGTMTVLVSEDGKLIGTTKMNKVA